MHPRNQAAGKQQPLTSLMQWCSRPGPSLPWAISKPLPSPSSRCSRGTTTLVKCTSAWPWGASSEPNTSMGRTTCSVRPAVCSGLCLPDAEAFTSPAQVAVATWTCEPSALHGTARSGLQARAALRMCRRPCAKQGNRWEKRGWHLDLQLCLCAQLCAQLCALRACAQRMGPHLDPRRVHRHQHH